MTINWQNIDRKRSKRVLKEKKSIEAHYCLSEDTEISPAYANCDFTETGVGLWITLNNEQLSFWVEKGLNVSSEIHLSVIQGTSTKIKSETA